MHNANYLQTTCHSTLVKIELFWENVKEEADNDIVVSKLSFLMDEISEVMKSLTDNEAKFIYQAINTLYRVYFVIRGDLLGKPVTAKIKDVVDKLKSIHDDYNVIYQLEYN